MTVTPDQRRGRSPATGLPIHERVVRRSLKDAAYDRLRAAILSGELAAGGRIIPADLAASLGISRTPVLQAMERLVHEALLASLPNGGFAVVGISEDAARELTEIRAVLESHAARRAAERGLDAPTLARLRTQAAQMEAELPRLAGATAARRVRVMERLMALNRELHDAISAACGNARLIRLLRETLDLTETQPFLRASNADEVEISFRQHAAIIEALARRDAGAAERLVREHVSMALSGVVPRVAAEGGRNAVASAERDPAGQARVV